MDDPYRNPAAHATSLQRGPYDVGERVRSRKVGQSHLTGVIISIDRPVGAVALPLSYTVRWDDVGPLPEPLIDPDEIEAAD